MTNPVGPVYTNRFEEFVVEENEEQYTILYLADLNNDKLNAEGKPQAYYWVPGSVRLARKGDVGDYKFRHVHFVGVFNEDLNVGIEGGEVAGGLLTFTTTSRYPTSVLQKAEEQLLEKFRGSDERYWGWRSNVAPQFAMCPIVSNITAVTNLSPGPDGTAPVEGVPTTAANTAPADGAGGAPAGPRFAISRLVRPADLTQPVKHGRAFRALTNLDAWAFHMQGQGAGSVTGGENAYAGLMGALPSEILWAGFHGAYSPIVVAQNLLMPVWSQELYIRIHGDWRRIFQHFSAHANAQYLWFAADIQAEFNRLRIDGGIEVEVHVDGTIPNGAEMAQAIDQRINLIVDKFTQQAQRIIFDPPQPNVTPAAAPSGGFLSSLFGGSGGLALKARMDTQELELNYEETRHHRYNQPNTISSSFEGFFNEIKNDPQAEQKYFSVLKLTGMGTKVSRVVKPVVRWPDPTREFVGEPVAFASVELGYPDQQGSLQWLPHIFQSTDTVLDTTWKTAVLKLNANEVRNPPQGWEPDVTFVRRRIHLTEPQGATDNPLVQLSIEENEVDIDPPGGTPTKDTVLEVRADSVGKLEVTIAGIDVTLQDASQVVTAEFQALGRTKKGAERPIVKFMWTSADQDQPRIWEIFTGQTDYVPVYRYRVSVFVKGTLFSNAMTWTGPWVDASGNGVLMLHVPRQDEAGVSTSRFSAIEASRFRFENVAAQPTPAGPVETTSSVGAPPTTAPAEPVGAPSSSRPGAPPTGRSTGEKSGVSIHGYSVGKERTTAPPSARSGKTERSAAKEMPAERASEKEHRLMELPIGEGWIEE